MSELLVGRRPFSGRSFGDFVLLHATMQPQPPSKATPRQMQEPIPQALDAIVLRCMAKRPEQRFQSAAELRLALAQLIAPPEPSLWSALHDRRRVGIVATAALVVASLVLLLSWHHQPSQAPAPPSTTVLVLPPELIEAPVAPPPKSRAIAQPTPQPAHQPTPQPTFEPTIVESSAIEPPPRPTFAPTIVQSTRAKRPKPRHVRVEGALATGELKDPFRAGQ